MGQKLMRIDLHCMRLLAGACGLFTMLAIGQAGMAQQPVPDRASPKAGLPHAVAAPASAGSKSAESEEAAPATKAGGEGVKVHGHWVLQVKNADGTLGERREFNNSLVTGGLVASGDQILAALLSGNAVAGDPGILLLQASQLFADASRFCQESNQGIHCYLMTTATSPLVNNLFITGGSGELQAVTATQNGLSATVNFTPTVSWVLSGNFAVPAGLTYLSVVQTVLPLCIAANSTVNSNFNNGGTSNAFAGTSGDLSSDIAPKGCVGTLSTEVMHPAIFTSTAIPNNPVTVAAGQIVTVTVTITFS